MSQSSDANFEVKGICANRLNKLKSKLTSLSISNPKLTAHYQYFINSAILKNADKKEIRK